MQTCTYQYLKDTFGLPKQTWYRFVTLLQKKSDDEKRMQNVVKVWKNL